MTANDQLTRFSKARKKILGVVKGEESSCVQIPQSSDEDLVVKERFPRSTQRLPVREPDTDGNHAPIGQAQNYGTSSNSQEIPVAMDNVLPDGTEDQSVTYPSGETLVGNFHVRRYKRIIKFP